MQNDNQVTLDLLQKFNGLPSLKKLQAHLNMDREDAPISRREWKEAIRGLLAADPVITASVGGSGRELFGEEQSFKVIYCRLASAELLLTHERAVVAELLGQYPYALFVFSDEAQKRFHFLNVKDEPQGQKRRLFRRITVGNGERLRTAAEQLAKLDGEALKHLPLSGIQARFDEAFDVGPVTKRFFAEYKRIFELAKAGIQGFAADQAGEEARNLFTQRLFNRLMFLAFIQKKGWLKYGGNADYLCTLWTAHQRDTFANKGSFYEGRLKPLFFLGLNTGPSEVNLVEINQGGGLKELIGDVPYLNGGLFEKDPDDDNPKIKVLDAGLDAVINDLFEKFNFTITESTPLDIEVAVDPEMLGKIFEELVTGRHESGSYYTPKPVVSFMCREALKGYLKTQVANEAKEAIARFVDRHEPDDIRDAESVLNALRRVTVCDPACGSGAYLLGMLHELLDLRESLFKTKKLDHPAVYDRKLEIIQTNIYGVDIAEFAVNIARLRLWLSLAVDFVGSKPEPLPNLDYKIEVGDSVCSPSPGALQMGMHQPLVAELLEFKAKYLRSHHSEKCILRDRVTELQNDIRVFSNRSGEDFDWVINFAEVFSEGGFDVVLANPPYVRIQELVRRSPETVRELTRTFLSARGGSYDLYVVFVERGLQILKKTGHFSYILPHKFFNAAYGAPLRDLLSSHKNVSKVVHFGDLQVFSSATTYVCLLFLSNAPVEICEWDYVNDLDAWVSEGRCQRRDIQTSELSKAPWAINTSDSNLLQERLSLMEPKLSAVASEMFQGIRTSANEVYVLEALSSTADLVTCYSKALEANCSLEKDVVKPFLHGRDIKRYGTNVARKVVLLPYSTDAAGTKLISKATFPKTFPSAWRYLKSNETILRGREEGKMDGERWYGYVYPKNISAMKRPKLLVPDTANRASFSLDESGSVAFGGGYGIVLRHDVMESPKYLLALLNSSVLDFYWRKISTPLRGGYYRYFTQFLAALPIRRIDMDNPAEKGIHDHLVMLTTRIIEAKQQNTDADTSALEQEIDEVVFKLYRFTPQEIMMVTPPSPVLA